MSEVQAIPRERRAASQSGMFNAQSQQLKEDSENAVVAPTSTNVAPTNNATMAYEPVAMVEMVLLEEEEGMR